MERITVFSPLGINHTEARPPSARIASLDGAVLGILNNSKPNSLALQEHIAHLLGSRFKLAGVVTKKKPSASLGADGLHGFSREVGAVMTAIGD
jgi:hypothetical protein